MEATQQQKARTHCSMCGQKVVRQDMPYCIYCGNHFELMEGKTDSKRKETRNMARLAKMSEHPDFAEAMEARPGEGMEIDGWRRKRRAGLVLAGAGVLVVVAGLALGSWLLAVPGVAVAGVGGWIALRHHRRMRARLALPLMRRPVIVTDRRSETEMRFTTGVTTYYFTFEFEDGNEAEFRYPGRGAHTEPLSKGVSGIAYTRGAELVAFRQIRV